MCTFMAIWKKILCWQNIYKHQAISHLHFYKSLQSGDKPSYRKYAQAACAWYLIFCVKHGVKTPIESYA